MQINSVTIPAAMDKKKSAYQWRNRETLGYNGQGQPIKGVYQELLWQFDELNATEWAFWVTTLLGGAAAASYTTAQLYDDDKALTTFTHCIVHRPVREKFSRHGKHQNVTVLITDIY